MLGKLTISLTESARFGRRIARLSCSTPDSSAIAKEVYDEGVDWLILRVPVSDSSRVNGLRGFALDPVFAGTLVYYDKVLPDDTDVERPCPDLELREIRGLEDRGALALGHLVRQTFSGYQSHYHVCADADTALILDGYVEWALQHCSRSTDKAWAWVAWDGLQPAAFACCAFEPSERVYTGVLFGVAPAYAGRGLYSHLLRHAVSHARDIGAERVRVSTQLANEAVQRAWRRLGFQLTERWDTFHCHADLSRGYLLNRLSVPVRVDSCRTLGDAFDSWPSAFGTDRTDLRSRLSRLFLEEAAKRHDLADVLNIYLVPIRDECRSKHLELSFYSTLSARDNEGGSLIAVARDSHGVAYWSGRCTIRAPVESSLSAIGA